MFGIAASRIGDSSPALKAKVASVLKPLFLGRGTKLIVEQARFVLRFESQDHCLFVIADSD